MRRSRGSVQPLGGAGADLDLLPFGVYDQGGALPQGLSVAYNGKGAT